MKSRAVLGVDPGVKGGMALLRGDGSIAGVWTFRPGDTEFETVESVRDAVKLLRAHGGWACFFEKVQHMTGDGGQGSHTFGSVKGLLRGALLMAGVALHDVYPMWWQATMECLSGGNKNVTKLRALQLFPGEQVTHGSADALLIAEYGRRKMAGDLGVGVRDPRGGDRRGRGRRGGLGL